MTETPKTKLHINPDKINYSPGYKLNPEKLVGAPQSVLPYILGCFYFKEEYEYYDVVKPYLDIPEPRKSLEEISQEFDEKIDDLIERTKNNFYKSKYIAETLYQTKFNRIIENFEYAKEHGQFPVRLTIGNLDCSTLGVSSAVDWTTEFRIGKDVVGYWDIKPNIKVYLKKKPNVIVRYFTKILLDFTWKDK
jgi:hypothetical protein